MKIKLNRGPNNGYRYVQPDHTTTIRIQQPKKVDYAIGYPDPYGTFDSYCDRGTYVKSNVMLKDGTWVFEWMGWIK